MPYPILAQNDSWFEPNDITITRSIITDIEILDSYTPDASVTVADTWDASNKKDGSITCYVIDTKLIIAGNSSGMISLSESAKGTFSDVTNWSDNFDNVTSILNLSLLDLSDTKNISNFFCNMSNLENVSGIEFWNTSSVTDVSSMFSVCSSLTSIDVSNWDVGNVKYIHSMFYDCKSLLSLDLSKWNLSFNNEVSFRLLFMHCENLVSVGDLSNWTVTCSNMEMMFYGCNSIEDIALGSFVFVPNTDTAFSNVVRNCSNLRSFSIKSFSTTQNISLSRFFSNCTKLSSIDLSNFDFNKVTDMSFMFYACSSLGEIDVSNWDVSNVTNFDHFAAHANLRRKGIENWNTKSAINMNAMFHNCAEEELDLSGFDTSKIKYFSQMFENSPNLKRIKGLENWDTSSGVGFEEMFARCYNLEEVDLSSFDTSKAKNDEEASSNGSLTATFYNIFDQCNQLKKITLGSGFSINGDGTNTKTSCKLIFPTPSSDYIVGADGNWYDCRGNIYRANGIPDRTTNTYFAVASEAFDSDTEPLLVKRGVLTKNAHAIRVKTGTTDKMTLAEMITAISNIDAGSESDVNIESMLISVIEKKDGNTKIYELPDGLTQIGSYVFRWNPNLIITTLPDSVITIKNQAFAYCDGLEQISLPEGLNSIENQAFYKCGNLSQVTFNGIPTIISANAFLDCPNLAVINVPWAEDEVVNAPWGATSATINYNYTKTIE